MFESLERSVQNYLAPENCEARAQKREGVFVEFLNDPSLYPQVYKDRLMDISKLSDEELYNIVAPSLGTILANTVEGSEEELTYFSNERFIDTVIKVVSNVGLNDLDYYNLNYLIYQYLSMAQKDEKGNDVPLPFSGKMLTIARIADRNFVDDIIRLAEISETSATKIALSALSSGNIMYNMIRMNDVIMREKNLDEQKVVFIYEAFVGRGFLSGDYKELGIIRLRDLFKSLMFPYLGFESDKQRSNVSMMITAVLTMIENSSYDSIKFLLIDYYNSILYEQNQPRFNLTILPQNEFPRILSTINELVMQNRIVVQ